MFPLNVPNVLTLVRIMLVPVLVVALLDETPNGDTIAAIVFAIAALTDGLDGYIARSREAVTTFGKVMDPIADKLLIAAALISLVSLDRVAAWVAMADMLTIMARTNILRRCFMTRPPYFWLAVLAAVLRPWAHGVASLPSTAVPTMAFS